MPFRFTYRFFALLDIISIILLSKQVYEILSNIDKIPDESFSRIRIGLMLPIYFSLFFSAAGLGMLQKWGAIVYYVQFPFRLVVWIFSFGFITYFGEYVQADIFEWMFRIVMILEFMRIYFTVKLHRGYFR